MRTIGLLIIALTCSEAFAQERLSEMAYFVRCYTQITGNRPSVSHPLRAAIKAGTQTGFSACMSVFNKAKLNVGGPNDGKLINPNDPEAVAVLGHMNDYHRSFFSSDSLEHAIVDTNNSLTRDRQLHDETEAALHFTRVMFSDNIAFSEVVTGDSALEALRSSGATTEKVWDGTSGYTMNPSAVGMVTGKPFLSLSISYPSTPSPASGTQAPSLFPINGVYTITPMNPELVQTGDLLGMRKLSANANKSSLVVFTHDGAPMIAEATQAKPNPGYEGSHTYFYGSTKVHESLGAGFIGAKSYLMLNLGRPNNSFSNGGLDMPRRWSKAVINDALCRDSPALRSTDAAVFIQPNSVLPFRQGRSCMQCHATYDQLAGIARSFTIRSTPDLDGYGQSYASGHLFIYPVEMPAKPGFQESDHDFYRRPPDGVLFFRSYNGDRISVPISGHHDSKSAMVALGNALAQTDDLYVCAASRYYRLFTGIKANLQDIGDPSKPTLTARDLKYRNEVINLGLSLKQHKSINQLIQDILKTDTYKSSSPFGGPQ